MSGIGNTVETDLVGEYIEVREVRFWEKANRPGSLLVERWETQRHDHVVAVGRCRAVTATQLGALVLWLEVIDESALMDIAAVPHKGDIHRVSINDGSERYLRLVKSPEIKP